MMNKTVSELQQHIQEKFIKHDIKKLGISISGGLDSSVLLYIICDLLSKNANLLHNIEIVPITGIGDSRIEVVESVINFVRNAYPLVKFNEHQILRYEMKDFTGKWAMHHVPFHAMLYKNKLIDVFLHAGTRNIPDTELSKIDFKRKSMQAHRSMAEDVVIPEIKYRNDPNSETTEGYLQWNIFMNYDKSLTASLYTELNLHEALAKLTWSCTGIAVKDVFNTETQQLAKPCEQCYWCAEKHWAFGYY